MPIFETILVDNGSNGHLVGKSLSLADLGLFEVIFTIEEYLGVDVLKSYPQIEFFLAKIKSIESISKYLKGSQKPPTNNRTKKKFFFFIFTLLNLFVYNM